MEQQQQGKPIEVIWQFNYKKGPAPMSAHVRARDAARAFLVAQRWCALNGARGPLGDVRPFVVADEEILKQRLPEEVDELADAVQATTEPSVGAKGR